MTSLRLPYLTTDYDSKTHPHYPEVLANSETFLVEILSVCSTLQFPLSGDMGRKQK
jgi:hypothetical protein